MGINLVAEKFESSMSLFSQVHGKQGSQLKVWMGEEVLKI